MVTYFCFLFKHKNVWPLGCSCLTNSIGQPVVTDISSFFHFRSSRLTKESSTCSSLIDKLLTAIYRVIQCSDVDCFSLTKIQRRESRCEMELIGLNVGSTGETGSATSGKSRPRAVVVALYFSSKKLIFVSDDGPQLSPSGRVPLFLATNYVNGGLSA